MMKHYARGAEMSVSKYKYDPTKCDGKPCIGDCDLCSNNEIESDGFITRSCDVYQRLKADVNMDWLHGKNNDD